MYKPIIESDARQKIDLPSKDAPLWRFDQDVVRKALVEININYG